MEKTTKTLTKRMLLDKTVKQYILDAIDTEGYGAELMGVPIEKDDIKGNLQFLYNTFLKEYGYEQNIKRYGSLQNCFKEWIMGLPSSFNVDFENYEILQLAVKWGSLPKDYTERQADKILENWFNFITVKTFQLFRKYKVA